MADIRDLLAVAPAVLGGRILADLAAELALLEAAEGFTTLSTGVRSDLRAALRLHAEWRALPPTPRRARVVTIADAIEERPDERAAA